jgi:hypothetical protein
MGLIGSFFRLVAGIIIFLVVLLFGGQILSALGVNVMNLPGTIAIGSGNSTVYIPVLASIVISLVGTLLINLIALPFRRASEA